MARVPSSLVDTAILAVVRSWPKASRTERHEYTDGKTAMPAECVPMKFVIDKAWEKVHMRFETDNGLRSALSRSVRNLAKQGRVRVHYRPSGYVGWVEAK